MEFDSKFLNHIFHYDNGVLFWKNHYSMPNRYNGKQVGFIRPDGYTFVKINRVSTALHKIIWCMFNDEWVPYPEYEIDHIDRNPRNNKIENLRKVTKSKNQDNSRMRNNQSGTKGVFYDKYHKKFKVCISIDSKLVHLGYYEDIEDAKYIRSLAERKKDEGDFDNWSKCIREKFLGKRVCTYK